MLDECVAIAVTNSMCTDLPVVHHFPYFVDQSSWCTLRSAFCDYFMSTVFSFDVLLSGLVGTTPCVFSNRRKFQKSGVADVGCKCICACV